MNRVSSLLLIGLACVNVTQAQTLYKCTTPSGSTEYRNSPCESGQRSAGAVNKGTVTSMTPSAPSPSATAAPPAAAGDRTLGKLGLEGLLNPIKAMRDDAAPIDKVAQGLCKSEGGFYVEGAGCLSEVPKNRNPLIGEVKMREICQKIGKTYVPPLNDCVKTAKP